LANGRSETLFLIKNSEVIRRLIKPTFAVAFDRRLASTAIRSPNATRFSIGPDVAGLSVADVIDNFQNDLAGNSLKKETAPHV
jgi:hypothetical protein